MGRGATTSEPRSFPPRWLLPSSREGREVSLKGSRSAEAAGPSRLVRVLDCWEDCSPMTMWPSSELQRLPGRVTSAHAAHPPGMRDLAKRHRCSARAVHAEVEQLSCRSDPHVETVLRGAHPKLGAARKEEAVLADHQGVGRRDAIDSGSQLLDLHRHGVLGTGSGIRAEAPELPDDQLTGIALPIHPGE